MAAALSGINHSRRLGWMLGLLAALLPGCVSMTEWTAHKESAPAGLVHQVHTVWEPAVVVTRDTENNGAALPGLAGRVYLFGPNLGHPFRGDGKLDFVVFDISKGEDKAVRVNGWSMDKDTLNGKLLRKDTVGWGYTVFLPSEKFTPNMARVKISCRYVPESGAPLFAPPAIVTLRNETRPTIQQTTVLPPGAQAKK